MSSAKAIPIALDRLGKTTAEERTLLELILKHSIITKATWERLSQRECASVVDYSSAMWSLTRRRIVIARTLHHGKTYFAISTATAAKLGIDSSRAKPLSESAKLQLYGRLLFFADGGPSGEPLKQEDLFLFLGEKAHGLPQGFYRSADKSKWLGFVRIDTQVSRSPLRAAQMLRHDIFRLASFAAIRTGFKQKRFEFSWVTATQVRADAVMRHFTRYPKVGQAPIRVCVFPELIPLVCSIDVAAMIDPNSLVEGLPSTNPTALRLKS